jgi:hypothetical protein
MMKKVCTLKYIRNLTAIAVVISAFISAILEGNDILLKVICPIGLIIMVVCNISINKSK